MAGGEYPTYGGPQSGIALKASPAPPNPNNARGDRVGGIDALRAVMCAGIALYHFTPYFFGSDDAEYRISRFFAYFTDMFFVFAGLFLGPRSKTWTNADYGAFLSSRLARLYPLHLVILSLYVLIGAAGTLGLIEASSNDRYDWSALLPHLTLTHGWGFGPAIAYNYPSWAVSAIFGCLLLFPLLSLAASRSHAWLVGLILFTAAAGWYVAEAHGTELTNLQDVGLGIFRALPSFLAGLLLGRLSLSTRSRIFSSGLLLLILAVAFFRDAPLSGVPRLLMVALLVTSVVLVDRAQLWTPLSFKALQRAGRYSYGVYLIHGLVATVLIRIVFQHIFGPDLTLVGDRTPALAHALILSAVAASFVAAHISLATIEKHGARLFLRLANQNVLASRTATL